MESMNLLRRSRYFADHVIYKLFGSTLDIYPMENSLLGKPVLVVGNGPSLRETPLELFKNIYSIGMNKIDLIYNDIEWRPNIVVAQNRHVINQQSEVYLQSDIPIFIPWQQRHFLRGKKSNSIRYFDMPGHTEFSVDLLKFGCGIGHTVTFTALQLAFFLGASRVIVVGVDHYFKSAGKKNELVLSTEPDPNHFSKDYFGVGVKWNLPDLEGSEGDYIKARTAFQAAGKEIYDATINGKLNIFEKININEATALLEREESNGQR
jgi:hypothetical protein